MRGRRGGNPCLCAGGKSLLGRALVREFEGVQYIPEKWVALSSYVNFPFAQLLIISPLAFLVLGGIALLTVPAVLLLTRRERASIDAEQTNVLEPQPAIAGTN